VLDKLADVIPVADIVPAGVIDVSAVVTLKAPPLT
jgi:hypothetical protein